VDAGWGGGGLPKRRIPCGGPSENNGGSILHEPHMLGSSYTCGAVTLCGALLPSVMSPSFFDD
jgi:hypothetical protein